MKISVITITCNRLELTKKYLCELKDKNTTQFEHIIVDNNSTDGTCEWLYEKGYTVIRLNKNIGVYKALKIGIKYVKEHVKPDFIIKFDNDCELLSFGILDEMLKFYQRGCDNYVLAPLDIDVLPEKQPRTFITTNEREFKTRYVSHVGGIFVLAPIYCWYEMIERPDELVCEDMLRGRFWHSIGKSVCYLEDFKISHKGLFNSVKNYKLLNEIIERP